MRITVFTANQPRHVAFVELLTEIASEVFAVHECSTVPPCDLDDLCRPTPTMKAYFARMLSAEREVFGMPRFGPQGVRQLSLGTGDLNRLDIATLSCALSSDAYVVFGSSFIRGPLADALIERKALNIHMGISPYYRGTATNFWALYDDRPEYVGATIHLLTKGLDSGPILFHALPGARSVDPFRLGFDAVRAAFDGFISNLASGKIWEYEAIAQNKGAEVRYSRNADFTDEVAAEFLSRLPTSDAIAARLRSRDIASFVRPYVAA